MDFANVTLVSDDGEIVGMIERWDSGRLGRRKVGFHQCNVGQ